MEEEVFWHWEAEDCFCVQYFLFVSTDTTVSTDITKPELILPVGSRGQKPFTLHASQLKMRNKCAWKQIKHTWFTCISAVFSHPPRRSLSSKLKLAWRKAPYVAKVTHPVLSQQCEKSWQSKTVSCLDWMFFCSENSLSYWICTGLERPNSNPTFCFGELFLL